MMPLQLSRTTSQPYSPSDVRLLTGSRAYAGSVTWHRDAMSESSLTGAAGRAEVLAERVGRRSRFAGSSAILGSAETWALLLRTWVFASWKVALA